MRVACTHRAPSLEDAREQRRGDEFQGCGLTSTPACVGTTAYTQDCAKHDYGLGSFSAASDDYSFAGNNCSCSGVGTCS